MNKNLEWNVYIEDSNHKCIKSYNILNKSIVDEILKKTEYATDRDTFADAVRHVLMYHYWSRAEWEVVITDWPPHITKSEVDRLSLEVVEHYKKYNTYPYAVTINPVVGKKIDVWDQIQLNWEHFINYLWKELKENA